jgi:hypothetical protein
MAAGPHKSGDDPHVAGRALDIVLFANKPDERDVADRLVQAFLSVKDKLQFISLCYNHWEWNGAGMKFPKKKSPHTGHRIAKKVWTASPAGNARDELMRFAKASARSGPRPTTRPPAAPRPRRLSWDSARAFGPASEARSQR